MPSLHSHLTNSTKSLHWSCRFSKRHVYKKTKNKRCTRVWSTSPHVPHKNLSNLKHTCRIQNPDIPRRVGSGGARQGSLAGRARQVCSCRTQTSLVPSRASKTTVLVRVCSNFHLHWFFTDDLRLEWGSTLGTPPVAPRPEPQRPGSAIPLFTH